MDSGWFVVIGTAIGGLFGVVPVLLQTRAQARAERLKQATELAIEDYRSQIDKIKANVAVSGVLPLAGLLHFHARVIEEIGAGRITPDSYAKLRQESAALYVSTEDAEWAKHRAGQDS